MKTIKNIVLAVCLIFSLLVVAAPFASAQPCSENCATNGGPSGQPTAPTPVQLRNSLQSNPIVKNLLNPVVNFLSAGVGIVVVGTIILGGIQYIMAGDTSDGVSKAKQRITNGLIALGAYLLIFGFLQWIVPGGLFG